MSEKIKIQNISRGLYFLNLGFVKEGKVVRLPQGAIYDASEDEYSYLITQCKGAFDKGRLKVVSAPAEIDVEEVNESNQKSFDDIEKLMDLNLTKFRAEIKNITSLELMKDIRDAAVERNKTDKFMDEIDKKIKELADGAILL